MTLHWYKRCGVSDSIAATSFMCCINVPCADFASLLGQHATWTRRCTQLQFAWTKYYVKGLSGATKLLQCTLLHLLKASGCKLSSAWL